MNCPICGKELPEYTAYCDGCGARTGVTASVVSAATAGAPIKKRNIAVCIILSLLTCGIYAIYWFISMVNDLKVASGDNEGPSGGAVFLLSIITCSIYLLVWLYKAGDKVNKIRAKVGEPRTEAGILYLLLAIFGLGIVNYCLIQNELNKVATL